VPLTALVLARRISRPLALLADAAARVGEGMTPELLPESGPTELAALAATFNRMARQVKELMDNRTTLLAGISHDLRTPLARLRIALEMMPENAKPALIARMERDLEEMNQLIGGFLELAQGLGQEEKRPVDLAALLGDLAQDTTLEWRAPLPCFREVAPLALRRILSNLIENALRYGGGKPVSVACDCAEGCARISVFDRGPGIPPDQAEKVFQPFYRLESSRSSATGGSGLGLAIARQLADANGWQIELLAREGGGTEARLTIPG
jgi:two-component system osmolarity sensor histidine kinase EnvZ